MQKLLKALEVETCKQITIVEFSDDVTYMLLISKNGTKHLFLTNCLFYVSAYCKKASVTIYALSIYGYTVTIYALFLKSFSLFAKYCQDEPRTQFLAILRQIYDYAVS